MDKYYKTKKKYRERNPEKFREYRKRYRDANRNKIREYNKSYEKRAHVRNTRRKNARDYYGKNKNKILIYQIQYNKRPDILVRIKKYKEEYGKKYYARNKIILLSKKIDYYKKNSDLIRAKSKEYYEANKNSIKVIKSFYNKEYMRMPHVREKYRLKAKKRRVLKKRLCHDFTHAQWRDKIENTKGFCPLCSKKFDDQVYKRKVTMDHVIPITKAPICFVYTIDDVQPLCMECNIKKSNKMGGN